MFTTATLTGRLLAAPFAYRSWHCSLCSSTKLLSTKKLKPMPAGMRRRLATASAVEDRKQQAAQAAAATKLDFKRQTPYQ
jgi:hypothetical protein